MNAGFGHVYWLYYLELGFGCLSLLGNFFVIFVYFFYKQLRCFAFELVIYLTIACMFNNLSYLIHYRPSINFTETQMTLCYVQAFMMVWFETSQIIWTTLIAISLYVNVVKFDETDSNSNCMKRVIFLLVGFAFPLSFSIIGITMGYFGPGSNYCWINSIDNSIGAIIYGNVIYLLVWILIITNVTITIIVIRHLNKLYNNEEEKELISRYIYKLIKYPIIQVICLIPATINRIIYVFLKETFFPIQVISMCFLASQGLLYAIAYGYNTQVREILRKSLKKTFKCCTCLRKKNKNKLKFFKKSSLNSKDEERSSIERYGNESFIF